MFDYPIDLDIKYSNDIEYRKCIRKLIKDNKQPTPQTESEKDPGYTDTDDDITNDELDYDVFSASNFLKEVYNNTSASKEFMLLYKYVAAVMFSTDENTGFVILLSYDNLEIFHKCLGVFYTTGGTCLDNPYYTELLKKFIY